MTHPNQRLINVAARIERDAHRTTMAVEHIARELSISDGWPTSTLGDGGSRTTAAPDARIIAAAERRCDLISDREQLRDDITAFETMADDYGRMLDRILRTHLARPEPTDAQRCSGRIDPTCTNWASEHTTPDTGMTDTTICDTCFQAACKRCLSRAPEGRYIDGQPVCGACYKRALRQRSGGTMQASPAPCHRSGL